MISRRKKKTFSLQLQLLFKLFCKFDPSCSPHLQNDTNTYTHQYTPILDLSTQFLNTVLSKRHCQLASSTASSGRQCSLPDPNRQLPTAVLPAGSTASSGRQCSPPDLQPPAPNGSVPRPQPQPPAPLRQCSTPDLDTKRQLEGSVPGQTSTTTHNHKGGPTRERERERACWVAREQLRAMDGQKAIEAMGGP